MLWSFVYFSLSKWPFVLAAPPPPPTLLLKRKCREEYGRARSQFFSAPCYIFIDRDPTQFRHVLEYLRHGDGVIMRTICDAGRGAALAREFVFYNMEWQTDVFEGWHQSASLSCIFTLSALEGHH